MCGRQRTPRSQRYSERDAAGMAVAGSEPEAVKIVVAVVVVAVVVVVVVVERWIGKIFLCLDLEKREEEEYDESIVMQRRRARRTGHEEFLRVLIARISMGVVGWLGG